MLLTILLFTDKLIITSLNKDNTVIDLKKEILKKIGKPMPLKKFYLNKLSGKTLDESKTLGENNVGDNTTLQLKVKMGHFGETQPKDNNIDLDINSFILDTINIEDIVFVSWGNYLSDQHRVLREYRSIKYNDWHDVFRQQLPLPLLQYATHVNKDISMYSIDQGFEQINHFDIRNILIKFVEPIIINKTELFKLNTCDLLNEIGIECPYTDSTISLYFMKYTYGYCQSNTNDFINIDLCLTELKDNLDHMGVEYYIYGQALDIETLITNNNDIGDDIKSWFHNNKIKQRGGGINPGRVITGENLNEHVGRVIRLIDTQGFSDRIRYQIKDLSGSKYIQDLSGFDLRFGILLEEDEESNRYFAEDLEPYESLARLRYNNGRIYYFAVPKTFQDIRDHGVFPYYLELANVGLPPYDINPELPNTGPYSKYEPDYNHIFSAYQIRKKLTQKKKLRDAKQKLALSHIPDLDNQHLNLINSHLSNIERTPQLANRMASENYPKINGGGPLLSKCDPTKHPSCKNISPLHNYMHELPHDVVKNIIKQTNIDENLKKKLMNINNNINSLEADINLQKQNIDKEIEDYNSGRINEEEYDIDYLLKDLEKMQLKLGKLKIKKKKLMYEIHKITILDKNLKGGKKTKKKKEVVII